MGCPLPELDSEDEFDKFTLEDMCKIVIWFIMQADLELKLDIVENDIQMLPFYGYDEKNRHIGFFGYGLF